MMPAVWQLGGSAVLCSALALSCLPSQTSAAEADDGKNLRIVQQRLTLASRMIQRIEGDDRRVLFDELEALQTRFLSNIDEQLVADSETFFGRVTARFRARSAAGKKLDEAVLRERYRGKLAELEAFRQSFDALVAERGDEARMALAEDDYQSHVQRAEQLAAERNWEEAYAHADDAYRQLIEALKSVRDQETVEYRLQFDSPADEYDYEIRRFNSQKMLLEMIVVERGLGQERLQLIDGFVAAAEQKHAQARTLAEAGNFQGALVRQESAVADLGRAMRVAGIYF